MQSVTIIVLGLGMLAYAIKQSPQKAKPSRFEHLKGWQKIFGWVAVALTLLMILNPEFFALGLFADTALFDMLVLALSLQMHVVVTGAFRSGIHGLLKGVRWLGIPSPGMCYLLTVVAPLVAGAASAFQRSGHRLLS